MRTSENNVYRIIDMEEEESLREIGAVWSIPFEQHGILAILLRVGVEGENAVQMAERILNENQGLIGLYRASYLKLCKQHGNGPAKAARILSAIQLGKCVALADKNTMRIIHGPQEVYDELVFDMLALDQEELRIFLLDTKNHILDIETVSRVSVNSSQVRIAEVFKGAIKRNAPSIFIVHNHPSGDSTPSPEDIALTRTSIQTGKLLDDGSIGSYYYRAQANCFP